VDTFAFIIHPIDPKRDVSQKFLLLSRLLTERQIDFFSTFFPPVYISEITGITSPGNWKGSAGLVHRLTIHPPTSVRVARTDNLSYVYSNWPHG
jgi:hypothetical protein